MNIHTERMKNPYSNEDPQEIKILLPLLGHHSTCLQSEKAKLVLVITVQAAARSRKRICWKMRRVLNVTINELVVRLNNKRNRLEVNSNDGG